MRKRKPPPATEKQRGDGLNPVLYVNYRDGVNRTARRVPVLWTTRSQQS
jgi:hypothetical protein